MKSKQKVQEILQDIEKVDQELGDLASSCEFTKQRRICAESQALLQGIHNRLEKSFSDLGDSERYTGILDRI